MRRWTSLAVLLCGVFLANLDIFVVVVAMPALRRDLGASEGALQLVIAGYQLVYALGLIAGGRLGDSAGPFRTFRAGAVLFAAASAACGLAPGAAVLVAARLVQGAGTALMVPQAYRAARTLFSGAARTRAFAAIGAVMGAGAVGGQLLGGVLIAADPLGLGWRAVFLVNLPIALVALHRPTVPRGRSGSAALDLPGIGLAAAALGAVAVPLVLGREQGFPRWVPVCLILALPLAIAFARHEAAVHERGGTPLVPPPLLRVPGFLRGLVMVGLVNCGLHAFVLVLGLLLQDGLGWGPIATGLGMLPPAGAFACASLLAPRLRIGEPRLLRLAALLATAGYLGCAVTALHGGTAELLAALAVTGAGLGGLVTPALSLTMRAVPECWSGAASGVVTTVQQLGAALGVCAFGLLFFAAGDGAATGFAVTSLAIAGSVLAGGLLAIPRTRDPLPAPEHRHRR